MAAEFAGQALFQLGNLPFTNTMLHTLIIDGVIITGIVFLHKNSKEVPGLFQNICELVADGLFSLTESVAGKNAQKIFPWFFAFFLFILIANWTSLFPGFGTVGFMQKGTFIPLLKGATSDINVTLGLALVSAVATHVLAVKRLGIGEYLSKYFSFNPIFLFVGSLELVSEVTKVISLSFRLFGNIMAGEVVLTTVSKMFAFILPLPFISLEIIVGLVQALVFGILTMSFMAILMTPHHEGGEH
jgi:F-type H+-transporting ATPase subunit a